MKNLNYHNVWLQLINVSLVSRFKLIRWVPCTVTLQNQGCGRFKAGAYHGIFWAVYGSPCRGLAVALWRSSCSLLHICLPVTFPKLSFLDQQCQPVPFTHAVLRRSPQALLHPLLCSIATTAFSGSLPRHIVQRLSQCKGPTVVVKGYTFLFHSLNFLVPWGIFISIYSCCNFLILEHFCQAADSYLLLKESTTC